MEMNRNAVQKKKCSLFSVHPLNYLLAVHVQLLLLCVVCMCARGNRVEKVFCFLFCAGSFFFF